jgi:hypothetical protein
MDFNDTKLITHVTQTRSVKTFYTLSKVIPRSVEDFDYTVRGLNL